MTIEPATTFPPGEVVSVSWTGMTDAKCKKPLAAATWSLRERPAWILFPVSPSSRSIAE